MLNQFHTEKVKLSFVLFDEIEKASDALWNLLLGILDKATLTLGDNRRVDFGRAMIFMTSNLGAAEMGSIMRPNLVFACSEVERQRAIGQVEEGMNDNSPAPAWRPPAEVHTGVHANRIDKTVVVRPGRMRTTQNSGSGTEHFAATDFQFPQRAPFVFSVTDAARDQLLREGTDLKYGPAILSGPSIDRSCIHYRT